MTGRRRNPSRACKASSRQVAADVADASSGDEHVERDEINRTKPRRRKVKAPIESDDSSFSAHGSDEEDVPAEEELYLEEEGQDEQLDEEEQMSEEDVPKPKKKRSTPGSKKKQTDQPVARKESEGAPKLLTAQEDVLSRVFRVFDTNENGRITLSDILRVADDHGIVLTVDEGRDMVRFWDTSGTSTISRETFSQLAVESKFMALPTSSK